MTQALSIPQFQCPSCKASLEPAVQGLTQCPLCRWRGEAYSFTPAALDVQAAAVALPDDATCIHHPRKKAVALCTGTGDYICSLCAVELHGQTYSAQYLETAGKALASKAFDRYLPRPDSRVVLALLLLFIPGVNYLFFLWIPYGFYNLVQAWRLRKQDDLYRRLVGSGRLVWLGILLSLISLVLTIIAVGVIFAIINRQS